MPARRPLPLLQGTLDMLILRTLILGPRHGHGIAVAIQRTSDDDLAHAIMLMQSTGQGGMQSMQPMHQGSTTVCMSWDAPTMASTGQASMHSVQPMQRLSSITATSGRFTTASMRAWYRGRGARASPCRR